MLLCADVFETDKIKGQLVLKVYDTEVVVDSEKSIPCIKEDEARLRFYVPKDKRNQELCYLRLLPQRIFTEVFMRSSSGEPAVIADPTAVAIIAALLNGSDFVIDDVLEEADIASVAFPDEYNPDTPQPTDMTASSSAMSATDISRCFQNVRIGS
jgi:hypothetical protein